MEYPLQYEKLKRLPDQLIAGITDPFVSGRIILFDNQPCQYQQE
jgi:hypothetical protein